jgi:hypothetical protein
MNSQDARAVNRELYKRIWYQKRKAADDRKRKEEQTGVIQKNLVSKTQSGG